MNSSDAAGRVRSPRPALPRRTALETSSTACSCPTIRLRRSSRRPRSFPHSGAVSFPAGMPVRSATVCATSSRSSARPRRLWVTLICWRISVCSRSRRTAARSYCPSETACSSSCVSDCRFRSESRPTLRSPSLRSTRAALSSSRSSALSGRKRSVRYRHDSSTAASMASCVMRMR